jgi:Mn2+/Fe2+ NRAMP family transporter
MTGLALFLGGIGKEPQIESRSFRLGATTIIVLAAVIGLSFGKSPVQLITISNVASFVSLPVLGVAAILAANASYMKSYKIPKPKISLGGFVTHLW